MTASLLRFENMVIDWKYQDLSLIFIFLNLSLFSMMKSPVDAGSGADYSLFLE